MGAIGRHSLFNIIGNRKTAAAVGVVTETDKLMAYIKQLVAGVPEIVAATPVASPLASADLWSCSGPVIIHDIWGIVTTTAIQAQSTTVTLSFDPDDGGSDVNLNTAVDANGYPTGQIIRCTKDVSEAALGFLDVAEATDIQAPGIIISQAGDIKVTYGAASTGQINWFIRYTKIGTGVITAA